VLRDGRLVAFPTDTVYGIGCRAGDADALTRLFAAKRRPASWRSVNRMDIAPSGER
jgi:L-threonylcarbamoyladenylate synthase